MKEYLLQRESENNRLNSYEKLDVCYQIALAMKHFEEKYLIHSDLAARNCIVYLKTKLNKPTSSRPLIHVKVSNIGLCGDKYSTEYTNLNKILENTGDAYGKQNFNMIPLRWSAPEVLFEEKKTIKSDIWSYSVTAWEIWKDGLLPYYDLSDMEVYQALKNYDLYRLDNLTEICPIEMWTLMEKCWFDSIEMRPSFYDFVSTLYSLIEDIS